MPLVSVIMNVWNGAATLREAVGSVIAQTFGDWELIVFDDCSTDDSAKVVAEFTDRRIRFCSPPPTTLQPLPLGQARDAAVRIAQGKWLAFLDQDDIWLPRKLELQLSCADSDQVGLVYGRTVAFGNRGEREYDPFHEFSPLPEGNLLTELLGRGCFVAMSSAMLRRSAVLEAGPVPQHIQVAPDYYWYASVSGRYLARAVQDVVCRYRLQPNSMTNRFRRQAAEESLAIVEQWRSSIPAKIYERRREHLCTALAVEDLRERKFAAGFERLLRDGSPVWLLGRPYVHLWRKMRGWIHRPSRAHALR